MHEQICKQFLCYLFHPNLSLTTSFRSVGSITFKCSSFFDENWITNGLYLTVFYCLFFHKFWYIPKYIARDFIVRGRRKTRTVHCSLCMGKQSKTRNVLCSLFTERGTCFVHCSRSAERCGETRTVDKCIANRIILLFLASILVAALLGSVFLLFMSEFVGSSLLKMNKSRRGPHTGKTRNNGPRFGVCSAFHGPCFSNCPDNRKMRSGPAQVACLQPPRGKNK